MRYLLCGCLCNPWLLTAQSQKIALLVGVSHYQDTNWLDIHGKEDVAMLGPLLKDRGFQVISLTEEQATKQAIRNALSRTAGMVRPGDIVLVHFSLHGQQITDLSPLDEPDGFDETLIPYDCPFYEDTAFAYNGALHLTDDLLNTDLRAIRQKIGDTGDGQLLVLLDACHSGDGTRSIRTLPKTNKPCRGVDKPLRFGLANPPPTNKATDNQFSPDAPGLAPQIAFFGTAPGQKNYEVQNGGLVYGSLSKAFGECLETETPGSYQSMFEAMDRKIRRWTPGQTPTQEGNLRRKLLGGRISGRTEHFVVFDTVRSDYVLLEQGWFAGLYNGTELQFYPPDTWDTLESRPRMLTTGVVTKSDLFGAEVQLAWEVSSKEMIGAWGYVTARKKDGINIDYEHYIRLIKQERQMDDGIDVEFEIKAYRCDRYGNNKGDLPRADTLSPGDCFSIIVRNKRATEVHFNLLDFPVYVRDTGYVLIPEARQPDKSFSVKGEGIWQSAVDTLFWSIDPLPPGVAYGTEIFKLVVSDAPLNLRAVLQTRGSGADPMPIVSNRRYAVYDLPVVVTQRK